MKKEQVSVADRDAKHPGSLGQAKVRVAGTEHTHESNVATATQLIGDMLHELKAGLKVDPERLESVDKLGKLAALMKREERDAQRAENYDELARKMSDAQLDATLAEYAEFQRDKLAKGEP